MSKTSTFPKGFSFANRLDIHKKKEEFLYNLATLLGCYESFGSELPDGKRPDVLRFDSNREILFVGDAKNTETPQNIATQRRLFSYLLWFSSHLSRPGRIGIFAICFGNSSDFKGWNKTIQKLAYSVGIELLDQSFEKFDTNTNLLWFVCKSN